MSKTNAETSFQQKPYEFAAKITDRLWQHHLTVLAEAATAAKMCRLHYDKTCATLRDVFMLPCGPEEHNQECPNDNPHKIVTTFQLGTPDEAGKAPSILVSLYASDAVIESGCVAWCDMEGAYKETVVFNGDSTMQAISDKMATMCNSIANEHEEFLIECIHKGNEKTEDDA